MSNRRGYLYRVAENRCRRLAAAQLLPLPRESGGLTPVVDIDAKVDLDRAMDCLSRRQRQAVMLVYAWSYSYDDAAGLIGVSVTSLRNHLTRGLRRLQDELA